jgi:hypothetical protein
MTTKPRDLLQQAYAALDEMTFASHAEMPVLNHRYTASFARFTAAVRTQAPAPKMDRCEHCLKWHPVESLAWLDTDYTSDQAALDWSLEREDLLCKGCREELEATYGRWPDDGSDDAFERHFDR